MSTELTSDDSRIARRLFLFTFVVYAYFFGGGGWNQNAYFDVARAVVERHTIAIDSYAVNTGDVAPRNGHIYANKAPGGALPAIPVYAATYAIERTIGMRIDSGFATTLNLWICTMVVCGGSAALIVALLFLIGREIGASRAWSLIVALAVGLATPILCYATVYFMHDINAMWMLAALYFLVRRDRSPVLAGLCAGMSLLTNYLSVSAVLAFSIPFLAERDVRGFFRYVAGTVPPVLALATYQIVAFGSVAQNPGAMSPRFVEKGAFLGMLGTPSLEALVGITISPYRGLFYLSPFLLLAFGSIRAALKRNWSIVVALGMISGTFFLFNLSFNNWEAGFAIGPRYLLPIVPFLGYLMLHRQPKMKVVLGILVLYSFVANFSATAVDPQPSGSIPFPLEGYIYPLLLKGTYPHVPNEKFPWSPATFHGHTSVNRHHVLEMVPFQLFSPVSKEAEWASFNLGELITGPGSPFSLLPILLWIGAGLLLFRRSLRRLES